MKRFAKHLFLLGAICLSHPLLGQETAIRWMDFEQLEDSLALHPKKVFVNFYADWCQYCKKMDQAAFRDPAVIALLNTEYYAVRMDVETPDTLVFDGKRYVNPEFGKKRNPVHEIPRLLASRQGVPFTLPAIVLLDESFRIQTRYFQYLPPGKMREILNASH
jgi:thiol-disulfide isomerase/thioredoxin